jgi:hypothetical protein
MYFDILNRILVATQDVGKQRLLMIIDETEVLYIMCNYVFDSPAGMSCPEKKYTLFFNFINHFFILKSFVLFFLGLLPPRVGYQKSCT